MTNLVICPTCKASGKKSFVYEEIEHAVTLEYRVPDLGFYDEDGEFHPPKRQPIVKYFKCSNGHNFKLSEHVHE